MAGVYAYLEKMNNGTINGASHGCDCCSNYDCDLSVSDLEDHIKSLEEAIKETKELKDGLMKLKGLI